MNQSTIQDCQLYNVMQMLHKLKRSLMTQTKPFYKSLPEILSGREMNLEPIQAICLPLVHY